MKIFYMAILATSKQIISIDSEVSSIKMWLPEIEQR